MQTYIYVGVDREGRKTSGTMPARDEAALEERLRASGLWLLEAKLRSGEATSGERVHRNVALSGGARRRELIHFCTLMSFLLKVGIPLVQALDHAAHDCDNVKFRTVLEGIRQQVEAGSLFCESLENYPKLFNAQFVSLVKAGEQSGSLPETFIELKKFYEWQEQIISDVRQATIYPMVVLFLVCVLVLVLFTAVIPKFVALLAVAKVPLPLATRIVFGVSDFAKATWWVWVLVLFVVPALIQLGRKWSPAFAVGFDRMKFRMPLFGPLNHMLANARYAHNLAMLYRAGVAILKALELCEGLTGSPLMTRCVRDIREQIESGETLSQAMRKHDVFSPLLLRMTAMGEKTGNLDAALDNVADYYNLLIPRRLKKIISVMEPSLIIFLVAIVGTVAIAIFMPILSLMGSIR